MADKSPKRAAKASGFNAVKHSATSSQVAPQYRQAWLNHKRHYIEALQPANFVEQRIVERAAFADFRRSALDAWEAARLARLAREAVEKHLYAPAQATTAQMTAPIGGLTLADIIAELRAEVGEDLSRLVADPQSAEQRAEELEDAAVEVAALAHADESLRLKALPAEVARELGRELVRTLSEAGRDQHELAQLVSRAADESIIGEILSGASPLAPDELAPLWSHAYKQAARDPDALRPKDVARELAEAFRERALRLRSLCTRARALLEEVAAEAVLLPDADLAKVQRHGAHLDREYYRAMHEFEALRKQREGESAPLMRAEVYGTAEEG